MTTDIHIKGNQMNTMTQVEQYALEIGDFVQTPNDQHGYVICKYHTWWEEYVVVIQYADEARNWEPIDEYGDFLVASLFPEAKPSPVEITDNPTAIEVPPIGTGSTRRVRQRGEWMTTTIHIKTDDDLNAHFTGIMIPVKDIAGRYSVPGWKCNHCGWTVGSIGFPPYHMCPDDGEKQAALGGDA